MQSEDTKIINNSCLKKDYFQIDFNSPEISGNVKPGQFVNVQIPGLTGSIFRRPFSVYDTGKDVLSIIYKVVGKGTSALSRIPKGTACSLLGPLGSAYTVPEKNDMPVIAAGGYGSAATFILACKSPVKGVALIGARTRDDLLLAGEYEKIGFKVLTATEDGSHGHKGLVTDLLPEYIGNPDAFFYGCGPNPMMYAMARMFRGKNVRAELSLDHPMCCGVGACFACVVKVNDDASSGWKYVRSCKEGPVFSHTELYLE